MALINGINYSWADITVNILGTPVAGVSAISYSKERKIENNYGAGSLPISRGYGNYTLTASITLYMDEIENIKSLVASGDLQDIPEFDVIISFVNGSNLPVTHKLRKCRFLNNAVEVNQDDTKIEVQLDLLPADIEFN